MQVRDLARYGVSEQLSEIWDAAGYGRLLPVQEIAVRRYGLFRGQNLIVSAPTSSGKTFVGEMAAAHNVMNGRRCLYLVPLKALAAEKFRTFRERYEPLGAKVVVSSRDDRDADERIAEEQFDLAVVVYEKMQQILTCRPALLQSVGLVVADELQMLADRERGPSLEVLLTRIKLSREPFQFIGLSAVLSNSDLLSRWLDARFLEHYVRPIELRQGIVYHGEFGYETYNAHDTGREPMAWQTKGSTAQLLAVNAAHLARRGEQSLVFLSDKNSTRVMTQVAAQQLDAEPATDAINELAALEETQSRNMLLACLRRGAAFHNADLSRDERDVVERHFRAGAIKIICSTPTLALGVNLPARNVLIEPMLWDADGPMGALRKRPITKAEFDNMSGRAGRLAYEDNFGRAIVVARTKLEHHVLRKRYFESDVEQLKPQLKGVDLATHAMTLVAGDMAQSEDNIADFLTKTLTGLLHWRGLKEYRGKFRTSISTAIQQCVDYGLLTHERCRLDVTNLGRLCAVKGVSAATGHEIASWLEAAKVRDLTEAEALYALARTHEAQAQHVNMSTDEHRSWVYPERLSKQLPRSAQASFAPLAKGRIYQTYDEVKCMKVALLLSEWIEGRDAMGIEQAYSCLAGTIRGAAEVLSWLSEAAAAIAELIDSPRAQVELLSGLARRLPKGLAADALDLGRIRVPGFGRAQMRALLAAEIESVEAVAAAAQGVVEDILGEELGGLVRYGAERLACGEALAGVG